MRSKECNTFAFINIVVFTKHVLVILIIFRIIYTELINFKLHIFPQTTDSYSHGQELLCFCGTWIVMKLFTKATQCTVSLVFQSILHNLSFEGIF
jgi:hypothetical protein